MSKAIENEVWEYSRARAATKLVMLCVADSAADATRTAVIDPEQVAHRCQIKERWVKYNLDMLEEMYELEKLATNTYRVREYVATGGYLGGLQLNLNPENGPREKSSIKDPERQQALKQRRQRKRQRK